MKQYIYLIIFQMAIVTQCSSFKNGLPVSAIVLTAASLAVLHYKLKIKCFEQKHEEFKNYFIDAEKTPVANLPKDIAQRKHLATKIKHFIKGARINDAFIFFKLFDSDASEEIDNEFKNMENEQFDDDFHRLIGEKITLIDDQKKVFDSYIEESKRYRNINFIIALLTFAHVVYKTK
jgi:hypothetical protein